MIDIERRVIVALNVLSLFDGIACGMVALERAGYSVDRYIAYEIDNCAIEIALSNYPMIEERGDVFNGDFNSLSGDIDLLIGGSSCSYWSVNKGSDISKEVEAVGIGYDMFNEYARALRETEPRWFLYENNYSISDSIKKCISNDLGCEPVVIDSSDFSAQKRKRCYWTNIPIVEWSKDESVFADVVDYDSEYHFVDISKYRDTFKYRNNGMDIVYDTSGKGHYSSQNRAKKPAQKWNTVVSSHDKNNVWVDKCLIRYITPIEAERLQTLPDNYTEKAWSNAKRMRCIGNAWTVDVIAHILKGMRWCRNDTSI